MNCGIDPISIQPSIYLVRPMLFTVNQGIELLSSMNYLEGKSWLKQSTADRTKLAWLTTLLP
jgi:hypothetical protein